MTTREPAKATRSGGTTNRATQGEKVRHAKRLQAIAVSRGVPAEVEERVQALLRGDATVAQAAVDALSDELRAVVQKFSDEERPFLLAAAQLIKAHDNVAKVNDFGGKNKGGTPQQQAESVLRDIRASTLLFRYVPWRSEELRSAVVAAAGVAAKRDPVALAEADDLTAVLSFFVLWQEKKGGDWVEIAAQPSIKKAVVFMATKYMEVRPNWWVHGLRALRNEVVAMAMQSTVDTVARRDRVEHVINETVAVSLRDWHPTDAANVRSQSIIEAIVEAVAATRRGEATAARRLVGNAWDGLRGGALLEAVTVAHLSIAITATQQIFHAYAAMDAMRFDNPDLARSEVERLCATRRAAVLVLARLVENDTASPPEIRKAALQRLAHFGADLPISDGRAGSVLMAPLNDAPGAGVSAAVCRAVIDVEAVAKLPRRVNSLEVVPKRPRTDAG